MNKAQKAVQLGLLQSEQQCIEQLEKAYRQALKDINAQIKQYQGDDLTQSQIYQKQYQEAMKAQVSAILDKMQSDQYGTIQGYLKGCYEDSYTGVMFDLNQAGIPVTVPIQQDQVVKAVTTDSKLSKSLYESMGKYLKPLKRRVTAELTRGFASSLHYNDIARNIANATGIGLSNAKRIARTEGHRIQNAAALDAQKAAKEAGADVVKQWDSTLDGKTRKTHRKLDGQIREIDEPFEVGGHKAMAPGQFGRPEEDINCRCAILQRAKWALDEDELESLKQRAGFYGLDKTDDFEEFKKRYMAASAQLNQSASMFSRESRVYSGTALTDSMANAFGPNAREAMDGVYDLLEKSEQRDAARVWGVIGQNVKVNRTGSGAFYKPGTGSIFLDSSSSTLDGSKISTPFQTLFHEVGHAIDDFLSGGEFKRRSTFTGDGSLGRIIKKDWDDRVSSFVDGAIGGWKANKTGEDLWESMKSSGALSKYMEANIDAARNRLIEHVENTMGRDVAESYEKKGYFSHDFVVTSSKQQKKKVYGDDYDRYTWGIPSKARIKSSAHSAASREVIAEIKSKGELKDYANISDWIEALTLTPYPMGVGHGKSYWTRGAKYGLMSKEEAVMSELSSEAFAELFDSAIANPKSYELMKEYFPGAVDWFEKSMKEAAEKWTS